MKRTMKLTFTTDEDWAVVHETLRRLKKLPSVIDADTAAQNSTWHAALISDLCRFYIDRPATPPQSGEGRP